MKHKFKKKYTIANIEIKVIRKLTHQFVDTSKPLHLWGGGLWKEISKSLILLSLRALCVKGR